jgi:protein involved in polysaccharide export with SLBB domain
MSPSSGGPIRLRQSDIDEAESPRAARLTRENAPGRVEAVDEREAREPPPKPRAPSPFEVFVQRLAGEEVRRFGADLTSSREDDRAESNPAVPVDYVLKTGDEIVLVVWGAAEGHLRLRVDRAGRVAVPRVGTVQVAGVRFADLQNLFERRFAQTFRQTELSVTLGRLRAMRVYVTGYVDRPGPITVPALSTMVHAVMRAGGPSGAGSFRDIQLRRGNQTVGSFDLYDLLLRGRRGADQALQAEDVIHVGPVGREVALIGSVQRPAVFELLPSEALGDLLQMAGGFNAVADRTRVAIERLDDRATTRITQLEMPGKANTTLTSGDVVRAFSAVDAALPVQRQNKRVRIEGEVARPGDYVLPAQSTLADALTAAGGMTPSAFPFGSEFMRDSVRVTQQQNYERALRDLETELARASTSMRTATADEAAAQNARASSTTRLIDRLRAVKPTGRVVLQLPAGTKELPALALEDGDRLYIPPKPTSVGVFGSVFNAGSYLYDDGREVDDFLKLAGGPTRGADTRSVFVVRANGSVVSGRDRSSWWSDDTGLERVRAEPGDTIFVPEEWNKTTWTQHAKDWGQIVSQFGLGIAAILAITR